MVYEMRYFFSLIKILDKNVYVLPAFLYSLSSPRNDRCFVLLYSTCICNMRKCFFQSRPWSPIPDREKHFS